MKRFFEMKEKLYYKWKMKMKFIFSLALLTGILTGCGLIVTKEEEPKEIVETIPAETVEETNSSDEVQETSPATNAVSMELPGEQNAFWVEQKLGQDAAIDLDGDGKDDVVHYELSKYTDYGNEYDYVKSLSINGTEYASEGAEYAWNTLDKWGIPMETPYTEAYYVVDLDISDQYREIAICDWGASDDLDTYFIRYDGGNITYLGMVPGFPTSDNYKMDGKGQIQAEGNLLIFQTWWAVYTWKLDENNTLVQETQDMYQAAASSMEYNKEFPVHQLVDLTIYSSPDQSAQTIVAPASPDAEVTFTETDNVHWVHMQRSDGVDGWLYIEEYCTIISNGEQIYSMDAFENLLMVG